MFFKAKSMISCAVLLAIIVSFTNFAVYADNNSPEITEMIIVNEGTNFDVLLTFNNPNAEETRYNVLLAFYDDKGVLNNIFTSDYRASAKNSEINDIACSGHMPDGAKDVKAFIWSGDTKIMPLAPAYYRITENTASLFTVNTPAANEQYTAEYIANINPLETPPPGRLKFKSTDLPQPSTGVTQNEIRNITGLVMGGSGLLFQPYADGKYVEFSFVAPHAGMYTLNIGTKAANNRGIYDVEIGGAFVGKLDGYGENVSVKRNIGVVTITRPGVTTIKFKGNGINDAVTTKAYGLVVDYLEFIPETFFAPAVMGPGNANYQESGNWTDSLLAGYNMGPVRESSVAGSYTSWSTYPPSCTPDANYSVFAWIPEGAAQTGNAQYTVVTNSRTVSKTLSQNAGGWLKIATVDAAQGVVITVTLKTVSGTAYASAIKIIPSFEPPEGVVLTPSPESTPTPVPVTDAAVYVNQSGYDTGKSKRATAVNVKDGEAFVIKDAKTDEQLFIGTVAGQIADFTAFEPDSRVDCYIECDKVKSYSFTVAKNWVQRVSVKPALDFMSRSREDSFENNHGWGVGWRDGCQFSFELNTLVWQYMANPGAYDRMPYGVYLANQSTIPSLRIQKEPDIIWLIKFGAERYYAWGSRGTQLHMLIKEQLAYFLYLYPEIKDYVTWDDYVRIRDFTISQWSNPNSDFNGNWYQKPNEDHNLFNIQKVIGGIKGSNPPGHSIIPNLMMYEVVRRDGLGDGRQYFDAAYANCEWLTDTSNTAAVVVTERLPRTEILPMDLTHPYFSKGQRMSEHITMSNLSYFLEMYPDKAPGGLHAAIERMADKMIARSNNMWDMRMASSISAGDQKDYWTGVGYAYHESMADGRIGETSNEPGNEAGIMAVTYAAARVVDNQDKIERLKQIGLAGIDNMLGKNPLGRTFFYDANIEGTDKGWFRKYNGGYGELQNVPGRLDGSPKEWTYPYNPGGNEGYTEGWVAFNTAWNASLAYSAAADVEIAASKTTAAAGESITVRLKAPVNFDYENIETVNIKVKNKASGNIENIALTEETRDDFYFSGAVQMPDAPAEIEISYGLGLFKKSVTINVLS